MSDRMTKTKDFPAQDEKSTDALASRGPTRRTILVEALLAFATLPRLLSATTSYGSLEPGRAGTDTTQRLQAREVSFDEVLAVYDRSVALAGPKNLRHSVLTVGAVLGGVNMDRLHQRDLPESFKLGQLDVREHCSLCMFSAITGVTLPTLHKLFNVSRAAQQLEDRVHSILVGGAHGQKELLGTFHQVLKDSLKKDPVDPSEGELTVAHAIRGRAIMIAGAAVMGKKSGEVFEYYKASRAKEPVGLANNARLALAVTPPRTRVEDVHAMFAKGRDIKSLGYDFDAPATLVSFLAGVDISEVHDLISSAIRTRRLGNEPAVLLAAATLLSRTIPERRASLPIFALY